MDICPCFSFETLGIYLRMKQLLTEFVRIIADDCALVGFYKGYFIVSNITIKPPRVLEGRAVKLFLIAPSI